MAMEPDDGRAVYMKDIAFYRGVVGLLGVGLIGSMVAIAWIAIANPDAEIPSALVAIGSGSLGALAGLFK